jgi:hypothetical protein
MKTDFWTYSISQHIQQSKTYGTEENLSIHSILTKTIAAQWILINYSSASCTYTLYNMLVWMGLGCKPYCLRPSQILVSIWNVNGV